MEFSIVEKQYTKLRTRACLFITGLLTILILMIIGLSKIYNKIYETLNNPESDLAEFAFCAYLLLPIIGARSFLIVLILFGVLYALDIIPNEKIVPNGNHAEDRSSFSIDESSDILSPALDFDFKIF